MIFLSLVYDLCIVFYLLFMLPKIIFERIFLKKKHSKILQRFGFGLPHLPYDKKPVIWIHGVSVGEIKSAKPLIARIRKEIPSAYILISTTTDTGQEEAIYRSCKEADSWIYFPVDLSMVIRKVMKKIRPHLIIFMESDFWFNFSKYAKKYDASLCILSGKMSKKSGERFSKIPFFSSKLFSYFDFIGVQNKDYYHRFLSAHAKKSSLSVTGNLKYDSNLPLANKEMLKKWKKNLSIEDSQEVITVASTHPLEEELILSSLSNWLKIMKSRKILLAPRHPERFSVVEKFLQARYTGSYGKYSSVESIPNEAQIILIDTMGFLPICFQLSKWAILGGSYISSIGGHNILEPIFHKTPVIYGPYMQNQSEMQAFVEKHKGGKSVLLPQLETFIDNEEEYEKLKRGVEDVINSSKNSLEDSWKRISPFFQTDDKT